METNMSKNKKLLVFYFHAGSTNHGCEAIVRTTARILHDYDLQLFSQQPEDDQHYGLGKVVNICANGKLIKKYEPYHFIAGCCLRILKNADLKCARIYNNIWNMNKPTIAFSIGGDNYCYVQYRYPLLLEAINRRLSSRGVKTVLWGCSIEPELLNDKRIATDLNRYSLITARESITYNALLNAGINKNTKLFPDPAFQLDKIELPLPCGFAENNTIGINVSPLILEYEKKAGMTFQNYEVLIEHIINSTHMHIALIPHVVEGDLIALQRLYEKFKYTGRVVMIEDHNCMELKGYIARCRMFLCARTHASIAAYSTCVPTLVVGYSIKAKGIAKDIFGTYDNYVIPVQSLQKEDDLVKAFEWLREHEDGIRKHLNEFMPAYCAKALEAGNEVKKLLGEEN